MSFIGVASLPPVAHGSDVVPVAATPALQTGSAESIGGLATASTVTQISKASELMSKLGQLSQSDPAKFKSVTKNIATLLAAKASVERQELTKRSTLQSELAQVKRVERQSTTTATSAAASSTSPTSSTGTGLAGVFANAAASGTLSSGTTTAVSWTEDALAGTLSSSLALVDEALGLSD